MNIEKWYQESCETKNWARFNDYVTYYADEIDFTIPTKIANKLTCATIVEIACKHKAALGYLPEYKDERGIIVDFMKNGRLSKEHKRPSVDTMMQIFSYMKAQDCARYGIALLDELGLTKEEYIKAYNKHKYIWAVIFDLSKWFKFRPEDKDIRKLYRKTKDSDLLYKLSKYTDKEVQVLFHTYNLDTNYDQIKYMSHNLSKFSDKAVLYAFLKFHKNFADRYSNNTTLPLRMSFKLIRAKQKGLYEVFKYFYSEPDWSERLIKYDEDLLSLKDDNLDVILSCIPDDKKFEYLLDYFNITQKDLDNWNIK
jgi:hypothetical protein